MKSWEIELYTSAIFSITLSFCACALSCVYAVVRVHFRACACAFVRARFRACVCAFVRACFRASKQVCVCVSMC